MGDDIGADKAKRVGVGAGAGTDTALPFRIGEVFVGRHLIRADAVFRSVDDAGAVGDAKPLILRVAEGGGDIGVQHVRFHALRHARLFRGEQAGDVDGEDQVGGRKIALGLQALDKSFVKEDDVDVDTRFLCEGFGQRRDQVGLAVGIYVHFLGERGKGDGGCRDGGGDAGEH